MILTLRIIDKDNNILKEASGNEEVTMVYENLYKDGDIISLSSDSACFVSAKLEDSMGFATLFLQKGEYNLVIPFEEKRVSYSPKSFSGSIHLLTVKAAATNDIYSYRNMAYNPYDSHDNTCLFPHAVANVETRGESVFAARNAIDGCYANEGHGPWPYQSWGINRNKEATFTINFGRTVEIDKVCITTRADFPHDNWWISGSLKFSDGSTVTIDLTKAIKPQIFEFSPRTVDWIMLENLIQADDPSPFPALTQFEAWGNEV